MCVGVQPYQWNTAYTKVMFSLPSCLKHPSSVTHNCFTLSPSWLFLSHFSLLFWHLTGVITKLQKNSLSNFSAKDIVEKGDNYNINIMAMCYACQSTPVSGLLRNNESIVLQVLLLLWSANGSARVLSRLYTAITLVPSGIFLTYLLRLSHKNKCLKAKEGVCSKVV